MLKKIFKYIGKQLKMLILVPMGFVRYVMDLINYVTKNKKSKTYKIVPIKSILPCVTDRYMSNGRLDRHYFLQDIYVAKKIMENSPSQHYDVGSRVSGFIAHLLAGFKGNVTVIDIRPLAIKIENLKFIRADATNLLEIEDDSIESLSSLHAVEHFGLGRYGDPIDPTACFTAMKSLQRVIKFGGLLYFSVPIGKKNEVCFNSHRMFMPITILNIFDEMQLVEFSYIHDYEIFSYVGEEANKLIRNDEIHISNYDCGIFILKKCEHNND